MTDTQTFSAVPNEDVAFLGTEPIPVAPYYDSTYYELEREAIFRRCWLHVGRESEVAEPNAFMVRELDVARASILITRDVDGVLHAFHNFCTHRGTELATESCGNASSFSCRYHAWNFANDGTLRAVPDEKRFFDLDKEHCGLRPVAVDTCAGFVFVNLDPQPAQTLSEFLGPLADELEALDFASYTDFAQYSYEVDARQRDRSRQPVRLSHALPLLRPASHDDAVVEDRLRAHRSADEGGHRGLHHRRHPHGRRPRVLRAVPELLRGALRGPGQLHPPGVAARAGAHPRHRPRLLPG